MTVQDPPVSLDDSCSIIFDNTLFSYSSAGFQSLKLKKGSKWKKLDSGESVSGATCVGTGSAFFVVGGQSDNADYTGLQKYTYGGKWETVTPTNLVTKNRQWHSASYIKANDAIVIIGGSQDGVYEPSTSGFTIQASDPYTTNSHDAPMPVLQPMLLSWSDADTVMIGGDTSNTKVYLFNPTANWRDYGASLANAIPKDTSSIQGALIDGDDGSTSLLTFDMSQSPNAVERIVLQDENGSPVTNSAPASRRDVLTKIKLHGRDLTLDDWPEYNATLAPTGTRENYGLAQDTDGIVVITGGSKDEPIAMFDASENSWMNTTEFFDKTMHSEKVSTASSATSTSSTSTSSSTSTTLSFTTTSETAAATTTGAAAAPAGDSDDSGLNSNTILGITLGTILGFLLLLGLLLWLIRRRKRQQNHAEIGHARRASGLPADEKNPAGFSNDALPPPRSPGHFRGHHPKASQESYSSMAILMGRVGQQKGGLTRKPSNDTFRSSVSSIQKHFKSTISRPIPHEEPVIEAHEDRGVAFAPGVSEARPRPRNPNADPQDGLRRSSGWNRYWSGGSALQILGFGGSKRHTGGSEQSSRYSEGANPNPRITQDSATVPPLNFEGRPEVNSVVSGSPVVAQQSSRVPLTEGLTGTIERPVSKASSGYSSGIPESVNDAWDPTEVSKPWGSDRAPSSAYSSGGLYGAPLAPSAAGARPSAPSGVSRQPQLAMASQSSDMSWLNLGEQPKK